MGALFVCLCDVKWLVLAHSVDQSLPYNIKPMLTGHAAPNTIFLGSGGGPRRSEVAH